MSRPRITIGGRQLAVVIRGWLRATPDRLWGTDPNYAKLVEQKRHNPDHAPDPRREVADYIAARLGELSWEVSYPEPAHPFNPARGDSRSERPAEDRHGQP